MARPVYDEQFLPRLVSVFFATFHPTEGPKVVYQVPEGTIAQSNLDDSGAASATFSSSEDDSSDEEHTNPLLRRRSSDMTPGPREASAEALEDSLSELPSIRPSASGYSMYDSAISEGSLGPGQSDITVVRDGQSSFTIRPESRSVPSAMSALDSLAISESDSVSPHNTSRKSRHDSGSTNQSRDAEDRTRTRRHYRSRQKPRSQDALFDFSPLADYLIPKAPLCNRLITCTTRGKAVSSVHNTAPSPSSASKSRAQSFNAHASSPMDFRRLQLPIPTVQSLEDSASESYGGSDAKSPGSFKILSYPVLLHDSARYARNIFIFNLGFVFDGRADVRAYEPVVRKCARVVKGLEESTSFVSNPGSQTRMYDIIEQLFEDLNSYSESFVALPDAPHSSYLRSTADAAQERRFFSALSNASTNSLSASVLGIGGPQLAALAKMHTDEADTETEGTSSPARSRGQSLGSIAASRRSSSAVNYLLSQPPMPLSRSASNDIKCVSSDALGVAAAHVDSAECETSEVARSTGPARPNMLRSANSTHLRTTVSASTSLVTNDSGTAQAATNDGITADTHQDEAQVGTAARLTLLHACSSDVNTNRDRASKSSSGSASRSAVITALSSAIGPVPHAAFTNGTSSMEAITDSIVSLRTINASGSDVPPPLSQGGSVADSTLQALRRSAAIGLPGRREPPHGLGRTVRDAINLKLFPTYASPPPINIWDVPVTLLRLDRMIDANWDLTMARVCPFIDGINHVKRIAQLADADLELTRQCMEHLVYYGCIVITDLFQFSNMYTLRPPISRLAEDEVVQAECASYVTRPGYPLPSYSTLLRLYSLLRPGLTVNDWIESNEMEVNVEEIGIDVRRFISFGVIKGFLRRVHRYPVLLRDPEKQGAEVGTFANEGDSVRQGKKERAGSQGSPPRPSKRQGSDSRERKWERTVDAPAMSGIDPRAIEREPRDSVSSFGRTGGRRRESEDKSEADRFPAHSRWASSDTMLTRDNVEQYSSSQTKRRLAGPGTSRRSSRSNLRHSTATTFELASIALNTRVEATRPAMRRIDSGDRPPRSPGKRTSFSTLPSRSSTVNGGVGIGTLGSRASQNLPGTAQSGSAWYTPTTGASSGHGSLCVFSGAMPFIPPELPDLLDGTHSDDELCTRFGVSWNELQRMLVFVGTTPELRYYDSEDDDATPSLGPREFGERTFTKQHSFGSTRAAASYSRGPYGSSDCSRPFGSGTHRGGTSGWNSAAGMSGIDHAGDDVGRSDSQNAYGDHVWALLEPGMVERGDLGRVKIIHL